RLDGDRRWRRGRRERDRVWRRRSSTARHDRRGQDETDPHRQELRAGQARASSMRYRGAVMKLLAAIQPIEERLVGTWKQESRNALARVLHEVYMADGDFTADERADFGAFLARIGAKASEVEKIDLGAALALLDKDPVH